MRKFSHLDIQYLRECFDYDHATGFLYWKARPLSHFASLNAHAVFNSRQAGKLAGSVCKDGYLAVQVSGTRLQCHRIAYAIYHGNIPEGMLIDHANGNRADNRICNLRVATDSQNTVNTVVNPTCVTWHKSANKWQASVKVHGKSIYLGLFNDKQEAMNIAAEARREKFGEFAA